MMKQYEIPDVRDGLTSLQRRILWTMKSMGLTNKKPHTQAIDVLARVGNGENLNGYSSDYCLFGASEIIYEDTMVPMAQKWRHPLPLIEGRGIWGFLCTGVAATPRFTACRLSAFSEKVLLAGLNQKTVKFVSHPNVTKEKEPSVLPARIPNVLINGTSGSSHIPPHNLGEVIDAAIAMIKNPDIKPEQLFEYIQGPDFPTGGTIINKGELSEIYQTGVGEIRIRGTMEAEILSEKEKQIVVREISYPMIGEVDDFIEDVEWMKKYDTLPDIKGVWDESDYQQNKVNIPIILKGTADAEHNMELLYVFSELESSFDYRALLVSNGKPSLMPLHQMFSEWLDFYRETMTRQNHGISPTKGEMIAELQKIKEQFATPRRTAILDVM